MREIILNERSLDIAWPLCTPAKVECGSQFPRCDVLLSVVLKAITFGHKHRTRDLFPFGLPFGQGSGARFPLAPTFPSKPSWEEA